MAVSLDPAEFCANCMGKMANLHLVEDLPSPDLIIQEIFRCICSSCRAGKFSRCGGCHLVPYCSKECQLEHRSQHKKLCKDLAKRERRPETGKVVFFSVSWTKKEERRIWIPLPTQLPNIEIFWIDALLTNLHILCRSAVIQQVGKKEIVLFSSLMMALHGEFLHISSWVKDGKFTELMTAVSLFHTKKGIISSIEGFDSKIREKAVEDIAWETIIFQLARLYQILRMVKYKFINIRSIKKKKLSKYRALKPFYESGLRVLNSSTDGTLDNLAHRISFPPGTRCVGCQGDLGGKEAQLALMLKEDSEVVRVPGAPCVLDMSDTAKTIVVCGDHEDCSARAKELHQQLLLKETRALMEVLPDTRICYGCSRYSLKTHRCSRCREVRYCSQDCLNQDWREHKIRCREFTRPGIKELYVSKKLEGEAKKVYAEDCFTRLCYYDPFLAHAAGKKKNEEVD